MLVRIAATVVLVGALVTPAPAAAGGFATVGLESTPERIDPGDRWVAEFTVLAHGRTPADGLEPSVIVTRSNGDEVGTFRAIPSGEPGAYHAHVTFPGEGRFRYLIDDGYSQRHTFPPLTVGGATVAAALPAAERRSVGTGPPPGESSPLALALALAAAAGLACALALGRLRRLRGGREPALGG
jgi:hypothetical protein